MEEKNKKRKRSRNYTEDERAELYEIVKRHESVIENKKTDGASVKAKKAAWDAVVNTYNSLQKTGVRNVGQLQALYDEMKRKAKKRVADDKVQLYKTGGGNYFKTATALDELIISSNPMRFQGLVNPADELEIEVDNSFSPQFYSNSLSAASGLCEPSASSAPVLVIASTSRATLSDLEETPQEEEEVVEEEEKVPEAIPAQQAHKKIHKKNKKKLEEEALEIIASKEKVYLNIANVLLEKHKVDLERAKVDLLLKKKQVEGTNLSIENKKLEQQLFLKKLEKNI